MTYLLNAKRLPSSASASATSSNIKFGTDLNSEPAFLNAIVTTSTEFARAMNILGNVVRLTKKPPKDNSKYQEWVSAQYLLELAKEEGDIQTLLDAAIQEVGEIRKVLQVLQSEKSEVLEEIRQIESQGIYAKRREYWSYLKNVDRELWFVLDPIVSVQNDGTFFEAFSGDESVYARVFLPHANITSLHEFTLGTTNIDFSAQLEREFRRVRSYRPLHLTVGQDSVGISTAANTVVEEKIPLPETWVQGLVEVQSVLALATTEFTVSSDFIANIINFLRTNKEKFGPRSLRFILKPNVPIKVIVEPWGIEFEDPTSAYSGANEQEIRIWGRRRLFVLEEILPPSSTVLVTLLGSGMPSFWSVTNAGVELTVGLSGWTSNDWASKARFSSFIPTDEISDSDLNEAIEILRKEGLTTSLNFSKAMNCGIQKANSILQKLCLMGKAMFHPSDSTYRWRNLFPALGLERNVSVSDEERHAKSLRVASEITVNVEKNTRTLYATIDNRNVELRLNEDGRPTYAQCTCPYFAYHKLKAGPCRHMVALLVAGGDLNE